MIADRQDLALLADAIETIDRARSLAARSVLELAGTCPDPQRTTRELRAALDGLESAADVAQDALSGIEQSIPGLLDNDGRRVDEPPL